VRRVPLRHYAASSTLSAACPRPAASVALSRRVETVGLCALCVSHFSFGKSASGRLVDQVRAG
jgi:hypothetical protein